MNYGRLIAELIFQIFRNECGPFGNEDPERPNTRTIVLHSQAGHVYYRFNDNLSADYKLGEDAMEEMKCDLEVCDQDLIKGHYNSVLDLIDSDDGWFYWLDKEDKNIIRSVVNLLIRKDKE